MLEQRANSGVVQPTVCVLTGDVNLSKNVATALVQPDVGEPDLLKHWHTEASNAAKSGDVAFVKGTPSKAWDIPPSERAGKTEACATTRTISLE